MERRRLGYAVLGLLALVVVALAAATLSAPVDDAGGDTGVGDAEDDPATGIGLTPPRFEFLLYFMFGALVLLALTAVYGLLRQPLQTLRGSVQVIAAGVVAVGWVLLILYLMEDGAKPPGAPPGGEAANESTGGNGTGTGQGEGVGSGSEDVVDQLTQNPELLLVGGLAVLTLGVIAAAVLTSRSGEVEESFRAERRDRDTLSAIGEVAGEAADRLEGDAAVENEIYRAYKRMTDLLDLEDADARTPGEFRRAAVAAGMDPGDVDPLVRTFEAVRYGDREATDEREQRAIEALRGIEATYADGEDGGTGDVPDDRPGDDREGSR